MKLRKDTIPMIKEAQRAKFLPHGALQVLIFFGLFLLSQFSLLFTQLIQMLISEIANVNITGHPYNLYLFGLIMIIFLIYMLFIERRNLKSIGFTKQYAIRDYLYGYLVGVLLFSLIMFLLWLTGNMTYHGLIGGSTVLLIVFFVGFIIQGMTEEVMLRGYLLNSLAARHNLVIATIVNASLFGILHLFNNNVTFLSILNIILFGVFASVYALKFSNIWGIGALHSAWNFVQGNVYGLEVSGQGMQTSIFKFKAVGNEFLNGGNFGPEGGIITTIVLILATIVVYHIKLRRDAYNN